jgi:carbamoyl-phosphate synthase large subunit
MIKVLVTGAGAVLGQGIINALRRSTLDVEVVAADPHPLAAGLFWADSAYVIPLASDPAYMERLADILEAERPQLVLVGTDIELPLFAAHRHSLEETFKTHVLVSDPEVVAIADDKYLTFKFLQEAGFTPPGSALPEDQAQLEKLIDSVGFPLVVKPRIGARSAGMSVVHGRGELEATLRGRSGLVVQECVGDDNSEYTASVLVFDGLADASIVMRRDLRDGNTHRAYTEGYEELNAYVRRLGLALKPYGPANFQFRTDAQGRARVFEINGRFSGTTPLRALVGFNEVELCARRILFNDPIRQPTIMSATVVRHLSETLVTAEDLARLK